MPFTVFTNNQFILLTRLTENHQRVRVIDRQAQTIQIQQASAWAMSATQITRSKLTVDENPNIIIACERENLPASIEEAGAYLGGKPIIVGEVDLTI